MEYDRTDNHIRYLQDQIRDGIVHKIERYFHGGRMSILLSRVAEANDFKTDDVHPETLRALCHYAAVVAGEQTNTAILFIPEANTVWVDDGYDSHEELVENEFIVVPRSPAATFKRFVTRESLTEYDIQRRNARG